MNTFDCNICGARNVVTDPATIHREVMPCTECRSNPRFRGIAHSIQHHLLDGNPVLREASPHKEITGIGFSDAPHYARELERIFSYTNTYYHQEPRLDVADRECVDRFGPVDFVVCSDVLEHVPPPGSPGLENLRALVKPGGMLVFSVPYLEGYETIEHYPHLHQWRVVELNDGRFVVENMRRGNANLPGDEPLMEIHQRPVFHGGPGQVLEMRVFGEGDLFARLRYAGFSSITPLKPELWRIGYVWEAKTEQSDWQGRAGKSWVLVCR